MRRTKGIFWWLATFLISIFPAIFGLSMNSGEPKRNGNNGRQGNIFSTGASPYVAASTVPTLESQSEVSSQRRRARSSIQKPAAPLVDSTLLRFMSTQKKQRQKEEKEAEAEPVTTPAAPAGFLATLMEGLKRDEAKTSTGTTTESVDRSGDSSQFWLRQYNRNRVAKKLIEMGVEESAAYDAGEVIQSYVLARTARRKVRQFLKERDVLWVKGQSAETQKSLSSSGTRQQQQQTDSPPVPQYGLDDVIETFLQFEMTGNDVAAIFTHTPSVALMRPCRSEGQPPEENGETLEETIERSFKVLLGDTLKLRKYDARKVLRTCPGLLTMRGSRSSEQVLKLFTSLGVSTKAIARAKTSLPVFLSRSPADLFRIVAFLTSDAVRMPIKNIGPLLRRKESSELLDALAPVPRIEQARQGNSQAPLATLWGGSSEERRDQINTAYRKMSSTAWTLRHEIGCAQLGQIISTYPTVLLLDASKQILPTAEYLMNDLGIWKDDLPRVLQLYPMLLGMDISQMKRVASYFISIGVEEHALQSIFRAFPSLFTLDVEKDMAPVVEFLRAIGVSNIGRFVTRLPPVLGYSIERELIPKWKYLSEVCLYSSFELSRFPAYFSYPFDRVIKTRYEYLRDVKRVPTQILAVDRVVRLGDKDFARLVARDGDDGAAFRQFIEARNAKRAKARTKRAKQTGAKATKRKQ